MSRKTRKMHKSFAPFDSFRKQSFFKSRGRILEEKIRKKALAFMSAVSNLLEGPKADPELPDIREALEL